MEYLGYLCTFLMGILLGVLGAGGSILTVPIFIYLFGLEPLVATFYSLFVVGITSLVGGFGYLRRGHVDFKVGALFAIPSFIGVFTARHFLLPNTPEIIFATDAFSIHKGPFVMVIFGTVMIFAARAMIRSKGATTSGTQKSISIVNIAFKGFLVGLLTGFIGAGGGFLIIPALVLMVGLPMKIAVGTSLMLVAANALFGFSLDLIETTPAWNFLLVISALGIGGILIGTRLADSMNERKMKMGFGWFVFFIGAFILGDNLIRMF